MHGAVPLQIVRDELYVESGEHRYTMKNAQALADERMALIRARQALNEAEAKEAVDAGVTGRTSTASSRGPGDLSIEGSKAKKPRKRSR